MQEEKLKEAFIKVAEATKESAEGIAESLKKVGETTQNDDRTLDEIIQEIADEEGMTFEQTKAMFKKGARMAMGAPKPKSAKEKAKDKKKRKQAKASRKRNR